MRGTGLIKIEQPFEGDNKVYYVNGGRCSGKVDKIINELVDCINELQQENQKYKEVIDKAIYFINNNGEKQYNHHDNYRGKWYSPDELDSILDILKEVE